MPEIVVTDSPDTRANRRVPPWSSLLVLIAVFPVLYLTSVAWNWITNANMDEELDPAAIAAIITLCGLTRFAWSRSSWRHWIAMIAGFGAAITLPQAAVNLVPVAYRHDWYAIAPTSLLGALAAVCIYIALSRLTGFEPPERQVTISEATSPARSPARPR
jgi:hypothetical protein